MCRTFLDPARLDGADFARRRANLRFSFGDRTIRDGLWLRNYDQLDEASCAGPLGRFPAPRQSAITSGRLHRPPSAAHRSTATEMTRPAVTVVIPTHNRADLMPATLRSVLAQQDVDLKVVVVDDGSSDATVAALGAVRDPRRAGTGTITRPASPTRETRVWPWSTRLGWPSPTMTTSGRLTSSLGSSRRCGYTERRDGRSSAP